MKNKTKRKFLETIGHAGVFLAGINLPVWAINTTARAATSNLILELKEPDKNGLMLLEGFTSRIIATTNKKPLLFTRYKWHRWPDGGATFATDDGGWIYVSNSENSSHNGGVGAVRFNSKAEIIKAYQICENTSMNCAGGLTPWNTWLTCEEHKKGFTWECDPFGKKKQIKLPSLGMFKHEAAAVDPETSTIYLTEDENESGFYRFVPEKKINEMGELSNIKGKFQVMNTKMGKVVWNEVYNPLAKGKKSLMLRKENKGVEYKVFKRGEGAYYDNGKIYFATTATHTIWVYDIKKEKVKPLYSGNGALRDPDNVVVSKTGLVMAAEDIGNMEICGISTKEANPKAFPIIRMTGQHKNSEVTGPAFNPSGERLYFSSQRGKDGFTGITFEVTGPFNKLV